MLLAQGPQNPKATTACDYEIVFHDNQLSCLKREQTPFIRFLFLNFRFSNVFHVHATAQA